MFAESYIEPDVTAVAPTRRWVRETLERAGVPSKAAEVVVLLVSETVTNAVVHARTPLALRVDIDAQRTRVEVRDGVRTAPVLRHGAPSAAGGRGVMFVDTLSTRWGTDVSTEIAAKTVWFELEHAS